MPEEKKGIEKMKKNLVEMEAGQVGKVVEVDGGHGFRKRLEALGIHPGMKITKISSQFMRGPVIVKVGATQIAIGFGMARRVLVEI
jgi:ferrous iron transport protein A